MNRTTQSVLRLGPAEPPVPKRATRRQTSKRGGVSVEGAFRSDLSLISGTLLGPGRRRALGKERAMSPHALKIGRVTSSQYPTLPITLRPVKKGCSATTPSGAGMRIFQDTLADSPVFRPK